jgi:uncharacterized membrane protein
MTIMMMVMMSVIIIIIIMICNVFKIANDKTKEARTLRNHSYENLKS